jgi:hypothetical protein
LLVYLKKAFQRPDWFIEAELRANRVLEQTQINPEISGGQFAILSGYAKFELPS